MTVALPRALAAEGLGTFALVFFGPGAAVVQAQTGALGHLGVAAGFGLTVAAVIAALAPVSGAYINPAATFAYCWRAAAHSDGSCPTSSPIARRYRRGFRAAGPLRAVTATSA
ncbi:hypothetical protein GCM10025871_24500 [Deinococcus metallilatus]|nr:hypothetical protein GCM10025871_24500 [Deinococcus metallilatus]